MAKFYSAEKRLDDVKGYLGAALSLVHVPGRDQILREAYHDLLRTYGRIEALRLRAEHEGEAEQAEAVA